MYTDPVADMLNRIKTAQAAAKPMVDIPFSSLKSDIALCMEKEGFIQKIIRKKKEGKKYLRIILSYDKKNIPAITDIKRVSSPGQRIYRKNKELGVVRGGEGVSILSTPKGVMTSREAKRKGLGGELICEIW